MTVVRRKDYEYTDEEGALAFLDGVTHGFVGFVRPDGSPGMIALNFARIDRMLYFHGSAEGEKMTSLAREPRAVFMATDDFSLVPSYYRDPALACPATQYYKAVVVHGEIRFVETRAEKAAGLQALMEKLQPEGGYEPIADNRRYRKSLDSTAVLALPIVELTAKFKFGQNLPKRKRAELATKLEERGEGRDAETVAAMCEFAPF